MSAAHSGRDFIAHLRTPKAVVALAFVTALLLAGFVAAKPADARTNNKSKTVLFVHGYNPTSTNTNCGTASMRARWRRR